MPNFLTAYNNCKRTKLMLELTPNRAFFKKYPVFHPGASIIDLKLRVCVNGMLYIFLDTVSFYLIFTDCIKHPTCMEPTKYRVLLGDHP